MQKYNERDIQKLLQNTYDAYVEKENEEEFNFLLSKYKEIDIQELYKYFTDKELGNFNKDKYYKLIEEDFERSAHDKKDIDLIAENHVLKLLCKWNLACEEIGIDLNRCIDKIERRINNEQG